MEALAITKIDPVVLFRAHGTGSWVSPEGWELIRQLKSGEMLELTPLASNAKTRAELNNKTTTLRSALKVRGLGHITATYRKPRIFAVYYPEQRDGAG